MFKRKEKSPVSKGYNKRFHKYSYLANQVARGFKKDLGFRFRSMS